MKIKDQAAYDDWKAKNRDGYGGATLAFAERWADMIDAEIAKGSALETVADRLSSRADVEGITGFMYGAAVHFLSQTWEHGERLRRWHNLATQIGNEGEKANEEGGTLNPALLSFGKKDS